MFLCVAVKTVFYKKTKYYEALSFLLGNTGRPPWQL